MQIFRKLITLLLTITLTFTSTFNYSQVVFSDEYEANNENVEEVLVDNEDEDIDVSDTDENIEEIVIDEENIDDETEENIDDEDDENIIDEINDDVINEEENIGDEEIIIDEDADDEEHEGEERYVIPGVIDIDVNLDAYSVAKHKSKNLLQANNTATALPEKFDLRDVDGVSYVTEIKDQGNFGTCWAHAIAASAESTSIMDGEKDLSFNLSEVGINYFVYNNRYADQLGLVTNDYSYCKKQGDGSDNVFNQGGNLGIAMFNLASGIGFLDESKLPYSTIGTYASSFKIKTFEDNYIKKNNHYEWCYNNDYLLVGVNAFNLVDDRNEVKKQLMENGAMGVSYYSDDSYYLNTSTAGYYCYDMDESNHAVTLVGWDDNFPKTSFRADHQPKNDGAWIIKNSWGDYYKYDDGYIYISYEDTSLNSDPAYQFDIEPRDPDKMIYQYDGTFCDWSKNLGYSTHYEANNYTSQRDEYIDSIGFFTSGANVNYTVYVYENNTSNDKPMSGKVLLEQSGNVAYGGFHTINLTKPVFVNEGKKFTIVVKQSGSTDATELYVDSTNNLGWWYSDYSDFSSDQSYYTTSSSPTSETWSRPQMYVNASVGYEYGNLRVKGYTNSTLLSSNHTYANFDDELGLVIHSDSKVLINKIKTIKLGGKSFTPSKNENNAYVSIDALFGAKLDDGNYTVTIETEDGFTKSFDVQIVMPIVIEGDVYLAFTSDIHNTSDNTPATRLNNWLNNVSDKIGSKFLNFASCGDMGYAANSTVTETQYWTYAQTAIDKITNNSNIIRKGFFVAGNHEWKPGNLGTTTNAAKQFYSAPGTKYVDSTQKYVFYSFGATSGTSDNKNYYIADEDIEALENYLSTAPTDRPIFILSHYPLHKYGDRTIHGYGKTIDVLNRYGDDHTIIYLWGHSHSEAGTNEFHYDTVYTNELTDYDTKNTNVAINFTYAAAGCMSDDENPYGSKNVKGKGLVAKVEDDKVTLTYYDKNYNVVGSSTTINLKTGTPSSTKYTVYFDDTSSSKKVVKNSTYGMMPTPTKTGYTFDGWYTEKTGGTKITEDSKVTITQDTTLYSHWTASQYTVTFDKNGGNTPSKSSMKVTYDSAYGDLATVTRSNYEFDGWYTAASGGDLVESTTIVSIAGNHTLYAHWSKVKYTVTFDACGGEVEPSSMKVEYNAAYGTLPTPTRAGYKFDGWYTAASGGTKKTATSTVTGNHTLYAHWTANTYTVTFDANGGNDLNKKNKTKDVTFGSAYGTLPSTTKSGYAFDGWYTGQTDGTKIESTTIVSIASNHTLYAHWSLPKLTITFNANGGSVETSSKQVTNGSNYGELPTPNRTGYKFDGWYTSTSSTGTKIESTTKVTVTSNQTLYAHWTANKYKVTFDGNGGTPSSETKEVTYDSTYGTLPTASLPGYTFNGWFTASTGGSQVTSSSSVKITENQTLYAHWSVRYYTVTWKNYDGTVLKEDTGLSYGTTPKYDGQIPIRKADAQYTYTFSGWDKQISAVTDDITYTAEYSKTTNKYTYTFYDENGTTVLKQLTVDYGTTISKPTDPSKSSTAQYEYAFAGWYDAKTGGNRITSFGTITGNVNYYARYTSSVRKYTVTWKDYDGKTLSSKLVEYGTIPTYDGKTPTRTSTVDTEYTFKDWGKDIVAVTGDVTYTAQYTSKTRQYTYIFYSDTNEELKKLTVNYGTKISAPENPKKEADAQYTYAFDGWYDAATGGNKVTSFGNISADVKYYARFTKTVNKYKVTIITNDDSFGTVSSSEITDVPYGTQLSTNGNNLLVYGNTVTARAKNNTAQYSYSFSGWTNGNKTVEGNTTVTANFTRAVNKYTVTWKNYDGTVLETDGDVEYGTTPTYNGKTPTKPSTAQYTYEFNNWDNQITTVTGNVTYTAVYTEKTNKYKVTINVNSSDYGNVNSSVINDVPYGSKIVTNGNSISINGTVVTATPASKSAKYNYSFDKWSYTKDEIQGNTTITAVFNRSINKYKVKFIDFDGSQIGNVQEIEYDSSATAPTNINRTGYTFKGWDSQSYLKVQSDLTIQAVYEAKVFTISYNAGTGTNDPSNITSHRYGDEEFVLRDAKPATGYVFDGWYDKNNNKVVKISSTLLENLVLTAKYSSSTYVINYNLDPEKGEANNEDNPSGFNYTSSDIELKPASKLGYIFDGWYKESNYINKIEKIAHNTNNDVNIYAKWIPIEYTVRFVLGESTEEMEDQGFYYDESKKLNKYNGSYLYGDFNHWEDANGLEYSDEQEVKNLSSIDDDVVVLTAKYKLTEVNAVSLNYKDGSELEIGTSVTALCNTPNSKIYYKINNSDEELYTEGITLDSPGDVEVKVCAKAPNYGVSESRTYIYHVVDSYKSWGDIKPEEMPFESIPEDMWMTKLEDCIYTGKAITQDFRVYDHNKLLVLNKDYSVKYSNNTNASVDKDGNTITTKLPTVTITGKGNYSGSIVNTFNINPIKVNEDNITVTLNKYEFLYNGKAQKPSVSSVTYINPETNKTVKLKNKTDYVVTYEDTNSSGSPDEIVPYNVIITFNGNYSSAEPIKIKYTISNKTLLSSLSISGIKNYLYTGNKITQESLVIKDNKTKEVVYDSKSNKGFEISYLNNIEIGKASVTIKALDNSNYYGSVTKSFNITGTSLSKVKLNNFKSSIIYTGNPITQDLTLTYSHKVNGVTQTDVLKGVDASEYNGERDIDYIYEYQNNTNIGKATLILTGVNAYTGTIKKTYSITGTALSKAKFTYTVDGIDKTSIPSQEFTGEEIKPSTYKFTYQNETLVEGTDYIVSYQKNIDKGTATIVFTGINSYTGTVKKTFKITALPLIVDGMLNEDITVEPIPDQIYQKGGVKLDSVLVIKHNGTDLVFNKDYTLSYKNNTKVGIATVTIKGKGNYSGTIANKSFVIEPADFSILKDNISAPDRVYSNKTGVYKSTPTITDINGKKLASGTDYSFVYKYVYNTLVSDSPKLEPYQIREANTAVQAKDIIPSGTVLKVEAEGKGNYSNEKISCEFVIKKNDISKASVKIANQYYTGRPIYLSKDSTETNGITVTYGSSKNKVTLESKDFEIISYSNNINKGTASVVIKGVNNYCGTKTVKFTIKAKSISFIQSFFDLFK